MDVTRAKEKKGLISKTWEKCRSFSRGKSPSKTLWSMKKSKSWPRGGLASSKEEGGDKRARKRRVPNGCFTVYVGPQKQRFVIKAECANHPLFRMLLEEAELEYGFRGEGPLALPCNVDFFYKVLVEMDCPEPEVDVPPLRCGFPKSPSSYRLLTPSRMKSISGAKHTNRAEVLAPILNTQAPLCEPMLGLSSLGPMMAQEIRKYLAQFGEPRCNILCFK
ncbi:Small auxin-up RNA [Dillenia turbinata]|uniref:Small auxin-up RNA n=1 Tax=Dillenia turbinata TaxID=194707 RepID=A0AAN8Z6L0_9MAGN